MRLRADAASQSQQRAPQLIKLCFFVLVLEVDAVLESSTVQPADWSFL
jgi:hypothetical protein